jgi:hypothetical protein
MEGSGRLRLDPLVANRALAAWHLSAPAGADPVPGGQPSAHLCRHDSHRYAVITTTSAVVLAVYRVHPDGTLVHLDRWPGEIENYLLPRVRRVARSC